MALIGCLMLVIGPFLSWTTAYLVSGNSLSGLQQTNNEAFVLVILGIAGAAFAVASLALRRRTFTWAPFVVGLVCLGLSVYYYIQLRDQLRQLEAGGYAVSLGIGIYLCLAASVIVLLGAVVAAPARKTSRTESIELRTRHGSPK
jgi:multidrug transporter EmrE-like cation transporter